MGSNLFLNTNFEWNGIEKINYKVSEKNVPETFTNVSRQNLFFGNEEADFDLRYFECGANGHTTLEKHEHVHVVIAVRGLGKVIVGLEQYDVKPFDLIRIPSWTPHQLINCSDEPFGFFCTVDSKRDSYKLLTEQEVETLKENAEINKILRIPEGYFKSR